MLDVFKKIGYFFRSAFGRGADPQEVRVSIPKPVYVRDLFGGKVTIIVFGAPFNWNYAGTSREEMEQKNPGITAALEEVMRTYGVKRALVPKPAFNAKVVTDADLQNELLPNFFRGADADGVILEKSGDAYFLASADCLTSVIFDPRTNCVAALHCGRDALIDRKQIDQGDVAKREYGSAIDATMAGLDQIVIDAYANQGLRDDEPRRTGIPAVAHQRLGFQAYLAAGIRPETFTHPTWKAPMFAGTGTAPPETVRNMRMIEHLVAFDRQTRMFALPGPDAKMIALPGGDIKPVEPGIVVSSPIVTDEVMGNIDLFALVRRQLKAHRVEVVHEDEFDTATSKNADDEFLFHSNRRDKIKRNLVVIKLN